MRFSHPWALFSPNRLLMRSNFVYFSDSHTVDRLCNICNENTRSDTTLSQQLEIMFFNSSPTEALYNIEVSWLIDA